MPNKKIDTYEVYTEIYINKRLIKEAAEILQVCRKTISRHKAKIDENRNVKRK